MSADGHGVSGLQHNQNDLLIAYFAPYRWLRFTGAINEINILRHSRRFFKCAYKALLPAAP
ncbi:hypothetical protein BON81_00945 [Escherichia coli]|nr:hypothetical protein BON81_00945 [Escherichia coli]